MKVIFMVQLTNTLTGKKETFVPQNSQKVLMYVCGITPYDFAHIGHGRCYVTFDVVYRLLSFLGYEVIYARNFTDIDDKIIKRAHEEFGDKRQYQKITDRYIAAYQENMQQLNCKTVSHEPRVTDYIQEIIAFVQGLIAKGAAYEKNGSVYFRVRSFEEYGKFSKQSIDDLCAGARIAVDEEKEDVLDFALWKQDTEVGFASPWGHGRPGWHIECSAMVDAIFGQSIDLHGGGMDLIFPHHQNEIAQSQSLHAYPLATYWMHNAFVRINQEKMSKSLGNFFTLSDIFKEFDPMMLRFYFLKHYYRGPLDFSFDDVSSAGKAYKRLVTFFADVVIDDITDDIAKKNSTVQAMLQFLQDDFNTSGMFGVLFDALPELQQSADDASCVKYFIVHVLGLTLASLAEKEVAITPQIQALLDERQAARLAKDFKRADELRDALLALGVTPQDSKTK